MPVLASLHVLPVAFLPACAPHVHVWRSQSRGMEQAPSLVAWRFAKIIVKSGPFSPSGTVGQRRPTSGTVGHRLRSLISYLHFVKAVCFCSQHGLIAPDANPHRVDGGGARVTESGTVENLAVMS